MKQIELDGWQITSSDPIVTLRDDRIPSPFATWTTGGNVVLGIGTVGNNVPLAVLRQFLLMIDEIQDKTLLQVNLHVYSGCLEREEFTNLMDRYSRGEFDPSRWKFCVDHNSAGVPLIPCVGLYIMGDGGEQCEGSFHWSTNRLTLEQLESWVKWTFKVDRVLRGVG